ncbi:NAD(P)-dependent oxidoreductase [Vibrio zhugei]|uniref:precorrin-2 dehydrogenase n=1 Tax=Vibrio zhugei TaxID=2479546 RepID=A0ABV7C9G1_9VIBR|nr:NAD(P)-dependent oxidoreductase [Vibrio zhugei]
MQYFPVFLKLTDQPVLVVGGGEVACRKTDALLRAGARVTIISPTLADPLRLLVEAGQCEWIQNFYSAQFLDAQYVQVWATTDNPSLNHEVYHDAKRMGILVNVVDDQPYCQFITPAMIERGRIQIAISSGGASPVLIRNLREKIEAILPNNLGLLAEFGASKRNSIKSVLTDLDSRRAFWEQFFDQPEVKNAHAREQLEKVYVALLESNPVKQGQRLWIEYTPDINRLSLGAVRQLQQADRVLHPEECPNEIMDLCRRDAERERFSEAGELGTRLQELQGMSEQVCILVPEAQQDFGLLQQYDQVMKLAPTIG